MNKLLKLALGIMIVACAACDHADNGEENNIDTQAYKRLSLNVRQTEISDKTVTFADALLDEANRQMGHKDAFLISPLSTQMVLSMAANGCEGETLGQILECLNITSGELADLNDLNRTLLKQLPDFSANKMVIGNALFYDNEVYAGGVKDAFASSLADYYGAETYTCPTSMMPRQVNSWVSRINGSPAKTLMDDEECSMALLNALQFNAMWPEKPETGELIFHNANGSTRNVNCVKQTGSNVFHNQYGYVADIFYANSAFFMRLYIPFDAADMDMAISSLRRVTRDPEYRIEQYIPYEFLKVALPQFEFSHMADIIPVLQGCGVTNIFDLDASEMHGIIADSNMFLNLLRQNCSMRVDENGTEIKVITTGTALPTMGSVPDKELIVDTPFAFEIGATDTGVVILQGRVNNLK